jgi:hypothetical protein
MPQLKHGGGEGPPLSGVDACTDLHTAALGTALPRKYSDFMERQMKPPRGPPELHLTSSVTEKTLAANSEERLRSVLAKLEECREALIDGGHRETALLVSVAILELRMKIHRIADSELKALCDMISQLEAENARDPNSPRGKRSRFSALLKLVK